MERLCCQYSFVICYHTVARQPGGLEARRHGNYDIRVGRMRRDHRPKCVCLFVCLLGTATDLFLSLRDLHEHVFVCFCRFFFVILISLLGCALTDLHMVDRKHMKGYTDTDNALLACFRKRLNFDIIELVSVKPCED